MRIKHAINDVQSMSHDGGKILQSLQNNYLPLIDIVVRESIQNSLDAAIEGNTSAEVNFEINKFESEKLAPIFEDVDQQLVNSYPGHQKFLAISDKNTFGLTGNYSSNDLKVLDESNFHKLVFGIGKNQSKDGAGGSWGYGKTSYFRLGVGIVLYYTRIKDGEKYEERLIASIIEDPSKKDRLLKSNERGIAWWGEYSTSSDRIYPIVDQEKIKDILSIFGLKNYTGSETGTTIIIPYLNKLGQDSIDENPLKFAWEYTYEDTIIMAVQRWYFPRIWNQKYSEVLKNPFLECKINNTYINPSIEFEPVFKIYQEIYNSAVLGKALSPNIQVQDVKLGRNALQDTNEEVGYIAFREVSFDELKMTPPNNKPSALAYLGIKDKSLLQSSDLKVIGYSRKPGMVIEYSVNGYWANGNITLKDNHILLGFFVPNSNANLAKSFQDAGFTNLESYLRSIETSDHANWEDDVDVTIVKRIRNRTNQAITNAYQNDKNGEHSSATSGLSRKFGAMFLPPRNFGKTSSKKSDGVVATEKSGANKSRGSDVSVMKSLPIDEQTVEVIFKAFVKKESENQIYLQILTQDRRMDVVEWKKVMGERIYFPFNIVELEIQKIDEVIFNQSYTDYISEEFTFNLNDTEADSFKIISNSENDSVIEGKLTLNILSNRYVPNIAIRTL